MKRLDKKAQMGNLQVFIMGVVTVAIVLAVGLIVLKSLRDASTVEGTATGTATAATNATDTILTKLTTVPTWIGIIIVVALAFVVLSFFYGGHNK